MALMTAQLNQLDLKLGTFETTINARLASLEDVSNKYGEKMVAMGEVMERSGFHGNAILELQEGGVATHNILDDLKDRVERAEQVGGNLEAQKRDLFTNLDAEF